MKTLITILIYFVTIHPGISQLKPQLTFTTPYGKNAAVGKYANVNGTRIYYEIYGKGQPLLLIHGNQGSMFYMGNQIDYFKDMYQVIAVDNRGHGKSDWDTDSLTYMQIMRDMVELLNHLKLDSAYVFGWSDGGIVGILMAIHHPAKVKKLVSMAANLRFEASTVIAYVQNLMRTEMSNIQSKIAAKDTTKNWKKMKQYYVMMRDQPNLPNSALKAIKSPTLIIAGDEDYITTEHTLEIYRSIPNAQLAILPGDTHFSPITEPKLFNHIIERFFSSPFYRPYSQDL